jgi:hypothetical protein
MELAFKAANLKKIKTTAFRVHCIEIVLNALYYNPLVTVPLLERANWTLPFVTFWLQNLDSFRRVHDKKLSILTLCALLEMPAAQIPPSLQQLMPQLFDSVLKIFITYPAALELRESQESDDEEQEYERYREHIEEDEDDFVSEEHGATLESLAADAAEFRPEYDDDSDDEVWGVDDFLEEDVCFMTVLDPIDAYVRFMATMDHLTAAGHGPALQSRLNSDQLQVLQFCIRKAQEVANQK